MVASWTGKADGTTETIAITNSGSISFGESNPRCYTESLVVERHVPTNAFAVLTAHFRLDS